VIQPKYAEVATKHDHQAAGTQVLSIIKPHLIAASLRKASPVEEDHDRKGARVFDGRSMHVQEQTVF